MADFSSLCRVCAEIASPAISLLDPGYQQFNAEAMNMLNLKIDPSNGLPTNICPKCLKITNSWLSLKHTCALSQQYFSSILGKPIARRKYTRVIVEPRVKVNTVENMKQTLFTSKITVKTPENIDRSFINNGEENDAKIVDLWYTNPESRAFEKAAEFEENSTMCNTVSGNLEITVQTPTSCSVTKNSSPEMSKNPEVIAQSAKHMTGNLNILTEKCDPETPVVLVKVPGSSTGIINVYSENSASNYPEVTAVQRPKNSAVDLNLLENVANQKVVINAEPKKRELRVMLERIDVKKYMSEVLNEKKTETNNEKFFDSNIEHQFVMLDSEVQESAGIDKTEAIAELFLESNKETEMDFYTEDNAFDESVSFTPNIIETDITKSGQTDKLCHICKKSVINLQKHLQTHSVLSSSEMEVIVDQDNESRTCTICNLVLANLSNWKRHMLLHDKAKKYRCQGCEVERIRSLGTLKVTSRLYSLDSLATHIKSDHPAVDADKLLNKYIFEKNPPTEVFLCSKCGELFDSNLLLTSHTDEVHYSPEAEFEQVICNEVKSEIITVDEMDWSCSHEDENVAAGHGIVSASFSCSQITPTENKPHYASGNLQLYQCLTCKQLFKSSASLHYHSKVHETPSIPCNLCPKKFRRCWTLKLHMKEIHNSLNVKFKCHICGFDFKCKRYLQAHMKRSHK